MISYHRNSTCKLNVTWHTQGLWWRHLWETVILPTKDVLFGDICKNARIYILSWWFIQSKGLYFSHNKESGDEKSDIHSTLLSTSQAPFYPSTIGRVCSPLFSVFWVTSDHWPQPGHLDTSCCKVARRHSYFSVGTLSPRTKIRTLLVWKIGRMLSRQLVLFASLLIDTWLDNLIEALGKKTLSVI